MIDITNRLLNAECGCGTCDKCHRLYQSIRLDVQRKKREDAKSGETILSKVHSYFGKQRDK